MNILVGLLVGAFLFHIYRQHNASKVKTVPYSSNVVSQSAFR